MDSKIPRLERPQKRLRYFPSQESKPTTLQDKKWNLKDIDHLFDDLDSPSEDELDLPALSPIPKTCPADEQGSASPVPEPPSPLKDTYLVSQDVTAEGLKCEALKASDCPALDAEVVTPFKEHGPIKTSSPIEHEVHVDRTGGCYGNKTASPLLFLCGDDEEVPVKQDPSPSQEVDCSGQETDGGDDLGVDSPPIKFALLCKNQKTTCEEDRPILEPPPQSVQCAVPQSIQEESSQESCIPSVSTETRDTQRPCEPRPSLGTEDKSNPKQKDTFAFLLKLREASKPIPACSKPVPSKVSEPPPEAFDDDFMILEDDGPCLFSIPRKTDPNKNKTRAKQNKGQTSPSNKDAPADVVPQEDQGRCSPREHETPSQQDPKGRKGKAGRRGTDRKGAAMVREESSSPERSTRPESPANHDDRDKPRSNKKRAIKVPSKVPSADEEGKKHRQGGGSSAKPNKRTLSQQTEENAAQPSYVQRSRPAKEAVKKPKTGRGELERSREAHPGLELPEPEECSDVTSKNKLPKGQRKAPSKGPSHPDIKDTQPSSLGAHDPHPDSPALGKRKKRAPGAWWSTVTDTTDQTEAASGLAVKKSKQSSRKTAKAAASPLPLVPSEELEGGEGESNRRPSQLPSRRSAAAQPQKAGARTRQTRKRKSSRQKPEEPAETEVEDVLDAGGQDQEELNPQPSPLRQHTYTPGEKVIERVYGRTPNAKSTGVVNHPSTPQRPQNHENILMKVKRSLKAPGNWWEVGNPPAHVKTASSPPRKQRDKNVKTQKGEAKQPKPHRSPSLRPPQNGRSLVSPKAGRTAPEPLLKKKDISAPKTVKRSLATFAAILTSVDTAPPVARIRSAARRGKTLFPSQGRGSAQSSLNSEGKNTEERVPGQDASRRLIPCDDSTSPEGTPTASVFFESGGELAKRLSWPSVSQRLSDNTLKGFKSGPSSMIDLDHHEEEDEDMCLPSSRLSVPVLAGSELSVPVLAGSELSVPVLAGSELSVPVLAGSERSVPVLAGSELSVPVLAGSERSVPVLAGSEMCGPPLRPILLKQEDRANVEEWMKVIWPTTIKDGGQITQDQFQWFIYRGRALGLRVDLQTTAFSSGRIVLGSFTKKPLWVDHNFTSVFNVLTSCVSVAINGKVSNYNPGQTFMVPCGHAYNIHNLAQEPAVLYFNRIQAESPE